MEILNLRAAGMVVGGLGSAAGLFGVATALTRHEPGVAPDPGDPGTLTVWAVAALCAYAIGLLGAILSNQPAPTGGGVHAAWRGGRDGRAQRTGDGAAGARRNPDVFRAG